MLAWGSSLHASVDSVFSSIQLIGSVLDMASCNAGLGVVLAGTV